jgi:hypothetical protein
MICNESRRTSGPCVDGLKVEVQQCACTQSTKPARDRRRGSCRWIGTAGTRTPVLKVPYRPLYSSHVTGLHPWSLPRHGNIITVVQSTCGAAEFERPEPASEIKGESDSDSNHFEAVRLYPTLMGRGLRRILDWQFTAYSSWSNLGRPCRRG